MTGAIKPVSIIVPVLNESALLPDLLAHLVDFSQRCEIVIVDGGSTDDTVPQCARAGFNVIRSERGRARQMNVGARATHGEILLFLHADTRLPERADQLIIQTFERTRHQWGHFDVDITGTAALLPVIAFMMNMRSRLTGIATGDQAVFVRRSTFEAAGGFPDQPLMEDIELSRRLKRLSAPICLTDKVVTSGRRWETRGVWRTILLMWRLRLAYALGVSAEELAKQYR